MDFQLSEEQLMVRQTAREFAEKEIKPQAGEFDATGEFPTEIIKKLASLNFLGITIPEEYDGGGLDAVSYALVIEEISRACASTGVILSVNNSLVCEPILKYGTDLQKKKYLPDLASGKKLGCFALTEPEAGSDASNLKTTAVLKGDHYALNGNKLFITNGRVAEVALVFAMTDKSLGYKGISIFVVERGFPGYSVGKVQQKLGINASGQCELYFEDCLVPKENLLGEEGGGFKIALATLDGGRIGIAAQAVGIAQACLDECLKYSKERVQFGQPIAKFQAIQWMLADMSTEIEAARLLTYRAAFLQDKGERYSAQASMAKLFASETAMKATTKGIQIHGGYGYMKEYPMERFFRDAKVTEIYEGTNEIQRIVIASSILK
ncbi:MAG: acyl-CoA dehydrogenase [Acidobacteriota bacterium]